MIIPQLIRGVPRSVWALRSAVVLGPAVALFAPSPQGYAPSQFTVALVLLTAIGWALVPDHPLGNVSLLLVLFWWATAVGEALPFASVVAAGGLLLSHTAATLLGYGPTRTQIARRLVATWALRATAAWVVALAIWVIAEAYSGRATPASFWLLGLAAALIGAVVAALRAPVRES
jgi:hypothetical protein